MGMTVEEFLPNFFKRAPIPLIALINALITLRQES